MVLTGHCKVWLQNTIVRENGIQNSQEKSSLLLLTNLARRVMYSRNGMVVGWLEILINVDEAHLSSKLN